MYEVARIINEGIGNSFCHSKDQWQTFVNKGNLKKLCTEFNINVPKEFYFGNYKQIDNNLINSIKYPVIIKPVDSCAGVGISVCHKNSQLLKAINYAGINSPSSTIIIEEYIIGKEVVFTYMIQDNVYKLTASSDKYVYKDERGLTVIPDLYIYPCKDHDLYTNDINEKVITMLKSQGLNNCTIFFQTIEKDHKFYFFEAGLRYEGTKTYEITKYYNNQNAYHFYYDNLLKVKTDYDINKDDPKLHGHVLAMFAVHLRRGKIKHIIGTEKIRNNPKIEQRYYFKNKNSVVGKNPLDKLFSAYCIEGSNIDELIKQIRFIKQTLKVKDIFYRNMVIDSFDENCLIENKTIEC